MNAKTLVASLLWFLIVVPAFAQGYAGLGTDAQGFAQPKPGTAFSFPDDHGAHPAYRIEWWYLTANLTGPDGEMYGIQWTLFRSALKPETREGWQSPQLWMGHAAATTPEKHLFAERRARGGIGQAGVTAAPFLAWIDDWRMEGRPGQGLVHLNVAASGRDFAYDLALTAEGPLIFHGEDGYSRKSHAGQASYYYSQPFYNVTGTLALPQGDIQVSGHGWLDREWSSQPLSDSQTGWDWFSLAFETGDKLMAFRLRDTEGRAFHSGTWMSADGQTHALEGEALEFTPLDWTVTANHRIPTSWGVRLPGKDLSVEVRALNPDAFMNTSFPYWEGPVRVTGSHPGRGYLEMTGYGDTNP